MQMSVSMTGCSDRGMWRFFSTFSWSTNASRAIRRRRFIVWEAAITRTSSTATAAMALEIGSTLDFPDLSATPEEKDGASWHASPRDKRNPGERTY